MGMMEQALQTTRDLGIDVAETGCVTIGPFKAQDLCDLERKMELHGVFAFTPGCDDVEMVQRQDGAYVNAVSCAARGYLFDEDELEAGETDLLGFLDDVLEPGATLVIEGSYPDGRGGAIFSAARYHRIGGEIVWDSQRYRDTPGEDRLQILQHFELSAAEAKMQASRGGKVVSLATMRLTRDS